MKQIAILTSGIMPVPAVQGGAVENLMDFYLAYNDRHQLHDITVYSVWHPDVENHPVLKSQVNHYKYIKTSTLKAKLEKKVLHWLKRKDEYYDYTIEYYLHEAIKDIRKKHYDCIIIENRPGYALKLKGITDAKLVYHLHNENLDCRVSHAQEIYDAACRIITVSDYIKSRVQAINPQDDKTRTVHNGINLAAFSQEGADCREKMGFSADDFVLIFSGRINGDKGISELTDAMVQLHKYPHIKLLVVGSTFYAISKNEDAFSKKLQEKAVQLKGQIRFTGFIPYAIMPNYLRMADVAVIPSIWDEPFGLTVAEAQATGLPIITTRRGGIPEVVSERNAILLDTDKHFIDNLATAILDLYQHPEKRKQMSEASLKQSKRFDKDVYAANFLNSLPLCHS